MKSLREIAKSEQATLTMSELERLFSAVGECVKAYGPERDDASGTVTVDGTTFTFVDGSLRVVGYCQKCRMEVRSRPVKRFADIASLLDNFRPAPHDCMDVD